MEVRLKKRPSPCAVCVDRDQSVVVEMLYSIIKPHGI